MFFVCALVLTFLIFCFALKTARNSDGLRVLGHDHAERSAGARAVAGAVRLCAAAGEALPHGRGHGRPVGGHQLRAHVCRAGRDSGAGDCPDAAPPAPCHATSARPAPHVCWPS